MIKEMITRILKKREEEIALTSIANTILWAACRDGASQIIFDPNCEPHPDTYLVNFKVQEKEELWLGIPKSTVREMIVPKFRQMAGMQKADEQGVIQVRMKDDQHNLELNFNLRLEITSTTHGERVTLTFEDEYILN
jgi:type II secretory ATPase GspE/PulE/Tfp pilus assembly ATPase PilB-like protein